MRRSARRKDYRPSFLRVVREDPIVFHDDVDAVLKPDRRRDRWTASVWAYRLSVIGLTVVIWGATGAIAWVLGRLVRRH
jgi:hypothetical protein